MANANLTPTLIVDKNGRTTTVHRNTKSASTLPVMPPPASVKQFRQERAAKAERLVKRVMTLLDADTWNRPAKLVNLLGKTYSIRFVDELEDLLAENTDESRGVAQQIIGGANEYQIGEIRHFYRELSDLKYAVVGSLVMSMRFYHDRPKFDDLRNADEGSHKEHIALMKVTNVLHEKQQEREAVKTGTLWVRGVSRQDTNGPLRLITSDSTFNNSIMALKEPDLIQLVVERADEADEIVRIIREHDTHEAHLIRGILDGIEPALADGAL